MAITAGPNLNSVLSPTQTTLVNNYIDFTATATAGWAQQYLPDLMEKEAEVFGNRSIAGFLSQVGAEEAMSADQVVWSEQGRLHLSYNCVVTTASSGLVTIGTDIDGNAAAGAHGIRVGDTVIISKAGVTMQGYVSVEDTGAAVANITVLPYKAAAMSTYFSDSDAATIIVYGSEFGKGTVGQVKANEPQFKSFSNKPVIIKDYFQVNGSDASQIGWVEVSGEDGQNGYLWYLKAEGDTRSRFTDYLEMSMVESVKATPGTSVINTALGTATTATDLAGTEGLFAAIEDRGNETSGVTGVNAATDLAEFDAILAEFDKQGAIEENMMFVNRATALAMDDMLASMNSYGAGGTSYGVFDNSEDMALNLGFSGFRRGSYDFYKSDWKYLNDRSTRGALLDTAGAIRGVMIPAGVSSVYDQQLGKNLKRPFLHVRYRASQADDRKMKSWITGSVGGTSTSDLDAMNVHYLSERCLVVQGANNFMLMN
jgi:hypothetical protein